MTPRSRHREQGVTLGELMAVVAIAAVLGGVATPAVARYMRRAKTTEVVQSLEKISAGARAYFETTHADTDGRPLARQFPASIAVTPATDCCTTPSGAGGRCVSNAGLWDVSAWRAVHFKMATPHYYQYQFDSAGSDTAATFTAYGLGNLDCDAVTATWHIDGSVDSGSRRPQATLPITSGGANLELE